MYRAMVDLEPFLAGDVLDNCKSTDTLTLALNSG